MIRNDSEYKKAVKRLQDESTRLEEAEARLKEEGLKSEEIKRAMDPLRSFHLQLQEEVESYNKLKRGEFGELINLRGIGHLLISLRIFYGMSQTELAKRLGVEPAQVCRDERNEYHGISHDRVTKILDAFGVKLHSKIELPQLQAA